MENVFDEVKKYILGRPSLLDKSAEEIKNITAVKAEIIKNKSNQPEPPKTKDKSGGEND